MADEMNNVNNEIQEKAGCLGIGISFLIPLIGIILYFSKKSVVFDASGYLYAALTSMGISLFIGFIA